MSAEEKRTINHVMPGRGESRTRRIGYTSNYLGQLERIIHDDGEVVSYGYNAGGQIRTVTGHKESTDGTGEFGYVKDVGYDEFGQRVVMEYGNGVRTEYSYDPERRWLERIVTVDKKGTKLQNITYDINPVGNVNGYENDADGYFTKQTYGYDNLYQLVKADGESKNYQAGSGLVTMSSTYSQVFSFDGAGNGKLVSKASSERTMGTRNGDNLNYSLTYRYYAGTHKAEQIGETYYEYDGYGNLVSERFGGHAVTTANNAQVYEEDGIYSTDYGFGLVHPEAQGERRVYQRDYRWNERNLLSRSVDNSYRVEYRYGADGERAVKYSFHAAIEGETLYFNRFFQTDYSSGRGGWLESKHVFVGETRIATKRRTEGNTGNYGEENNQLYYYHGDHLGSAQLVTDPEGEIYEQLEYTPYGELWVEHVPVTEATPFRFTGKERDGETGLYYFGARYLNPQTGMWLSADPAMGEYIPQAPINDDIRKQNQNLPGIGGVFNYVNLHVYHYAGNNPVVLKDPDGRTSNKELKEYITKEPAVKEFLKEMKKDPNSYTIRAYRRRAFSEGERDKYRTHSFYVITKKTADGKTEEHTLSFNGTVKYLFSEGAWALDTTADKDSFKSYDNGKGPNAWDVEEITPRSRVNVTKTAGKIIETIDSNVRYFAGDHITDLKKRDNCNTALYKTMVRQGFGR
jgi:RHS repeat-associated protein